VSSFDTFERLLRRSICNRRNVSRRHINYNRNDRLLTHTRSALIAVNGSRRLGPRFYYWNGFRWYGGTRGWRRCSTFRVCCRTEINVFVQKTKKRPDIVADVNVPLFISYYERLKAIRSNTGRGFRETSVFPSDETRPSSLIRPKTVVDSFWRCTVVSWNQPFAQPVSETAIFNEAITTKRGRTIEKTIIRIHIYVYHVLTTLQRSAIVANSKIRRCINTISYIIIRRCDKLW